MSIAVKNIQKTTTGYKSIDSAFIDLEKAKEPVIILGNTIDLDEENIIINQYKNEAEKLNVKLVKEDDNNFTNENDLIFYLGTDVKFLLDRLNLSEQKLYQVSNKKNNDEFSCFLNQINSNELGFLKVLNILKKL